MPIDLAVVPVAGRGTRLLPLTKSAPKEMLPVGRKPTVQFVAEELAAAGVRRLLFITGPGKTAIENHFDLDAELIGHLRETGKEELLQELAYEREDIEYFYTRQRRQLGLGHAILCGRAFVGQQPFVVALGDSIIGLHTRSPVVQTMIEHFERQRADAVIAFERVPREEVIHYGIARPRGEVRGDFFELDGLVEKPNVDAAPSDLAVAARYVLSPRIFDFLAQTRPGKGGEIQLTDALAQMLASGGRIFGVVLGADQPRYDIGNFESYFQAFVESVLADPEFGQAARRHMQSLLDRSR